MYGVTVDNGALVDTPFLIKIPHKIQSSSIDHLMRNNLYTGKGC